MNGKELAGKILKVNEAKPEKLGRTEPGAHRGGYGSRDRVPSWVSSASKDRDGGGYGNKDGGDSIYDSKGGSGIEVEVVGLRLGRSISGGKRSSANVCVNE